MGLNFNTAGMKDLVGDLVTAAKAIDDAISYADRCIKSPTEFIYYKELKTTMPGQLKEYRKNIDELIKYVGFSISTLGGIGFFDILTAYPEYKPITDESSNEGNRYHGGGRSLDDTGSVTSKLWKMIDNGWDWITDKAGAGWGKFKAWWESYSEMEMHTQRAKIDYYGEVSGGIVSIITAKCESFVEFWESLGDAVAIYRTQEERKALREMEQEKYHTAYRILYGEDEYNELMEKYKNENDKIEMQMIEATMNAVAIDFSGMAIDKLVNTEWYKKLEKEATKRGTKFYEVFKNLGTMEQMILLTSMNPYYAAALAEAKAIGGVTENRWMKIMLKGEGWATVEEFDKAVAQGGLEGSWDALQVLLGGELFLKTNSLLQSILTVGLDTGMAGADVPIHALIDSFINDRDFMEVYEALGGNKAVIKEVLFAFVLSVAGEAISRARMKKVSKNPEIFDSFKIDDAKAAQLYDQASETALKKLRQKHPDLTDLDIERMMRGEDIDLFTEYDKIVQDLYQAGLEKTLEWKQARAITEIRQKHGIDVNKMSNAEIMEKYYDEYLETVQRQYVDDVVAYKNWEGARQGSLMNMEYDEILAKLDLKDQDDFIREYWKRDKAGRQALLDEYLIKYDIPVPSQEQVNVFLDETSKGVAQNTINITHDLYVSGKIKPGYTEADVLALIQDAVPPEEYLTPEAVNEWRRSFANVPAGHDIDLDQMVYVYTYQTVDPDAGSIVRFNGNMGADDGFFVFSEAEWNQLQERKIIDANGMILDKKELGDALYGVYVGENGIFIQRQVRLGDIQMPNGSLSTAYFGEFAPGGRTGMGVTEGVLQQVRYDGTNAVLIPATEGVSIDDINAMLLS